MNKIIIALHALVLSSALYGAPSVTTQEAGCIRAAMHNLRYDTMLGAIAPDNLRVVVPGQLYRGNTLPPQTLVSYIDTLGINTIINLRGAHPGQTWWDDEWAVAQDRSVALHSIAMTAHAYPPPEKLATLLQLYNEEAGPIFVHCYSGVDRAATASGVWLIEKEGATSEVAAQQLAFGQYGHVGFIFPQMRSFIALWSALRDTFSQQDALREYAQIYEQYNLAAVRKMNRWQQPVQQALVRIGVIIACLHTDCYVPTGN